MSQYRIERLQSEIYHLVGEIFLQELADPRLKHLVITRVRLTKDLGLARVYYERSGVGHPREIDTALKSAKGYIRQSLAKRLKLQRVPEIEFFYDETTKERETIENLFQKI